MFEKYIYLVIYHAIQHKLCNNFLTNLSRFPNTYNCLLTNLGGTKDDVEPRKELFSEAASDVGAVANSTTGDVSCDF